MLSQITRELAFALCLSVAMPMTAWAASSAEQQQEMLDQLAQLDELDHQDFLTRNAKANACVANRDFECADKAIAQAKRVARTSADKAALQASRDNLAMERELVASEARSRRQREEAEEADRRAEEQAIRAQERAEEQEAERQQMKYAAMAAGFALGGGSQLSADKQAAIMNAIARDSQSQGGDFSNFNQAVNGIRQDQAREADQREALRARQRELQQRQQQAQAQADAEAREQAAARQQARQQQLQQAAQATTGEPARAQVQIVQYVPQQVSLPTWDEQCPPGSSPARHPNGTPLTAGSGAAVCIKDNASATTLAGNQAGAADPASSQAPGKGSAASTTQGGGSGAAKPGSAGGADTKARWGAVQQEALALCRQDRKSGFWECNGAQDNQIIVDEPSLESALDRQHCAGGTLTAETAQIKGQQWQVYQCGQGVGPGDYDVAKKHNLVTQRRSYICAAYSSGRCTIPYTGQDKL